MFYPAILAAAILITANRGLWIASAAFLVVALVSLRIAIYTDPAANLDPRLPATSDAHKLWHLSTCTDFFNDCMRNAVFNNEKICLPCGHTLSCVHLALLCHPDSQENACPRCGSVLFHQDQPWEAYFITLAVCGTVLAAIRDGIDLGSCCWRALTADDGHTGVTRRGLLLVLLFLWELETLRQMEKAIHTRGHEWWKSWMQGNMWSGYFGLPVAVYWAVWLPFEFQRAATT